MIKDWKDKKIGILGLGVEGLSSAEYLVSLGAKVTILDCKKEEEVDTEKLALAKKLQVEFVLGEE